MNKGFYKADGYWCYYKTWKNSSENFGASVSFKGPNNIYEEFRWKNVSEINAGLLVGAACLAQW